MSDPEKIRRWPQSEQDFPGARVPLDVQQGATFSRDVRPRYRSTLTCDCGGMGEGAVTFLMLNPSTATSDENDPTIDKFCKYAARWGYCWLYAVNLSPVRATAPEEMLGKLPEPDDVMATNMVAIREAARNSDLLVAAYGANPKMKERADLVMESLESHEIFCLKITKHGYPNHPLYLKDDLQPIRYRPRKRS